jgi:isoleucyl-tRNA synthetase
MLATLPVGSPSRYAFTDTANRSSVTVSFPLVDDPETCFLAWTTTPWTLPSNLALCVHPDYVYIRIHDQERNKNFILHEKLLGTLYKDPKKAKFKKLEQFVGKDLKGWRYVPLFDYFVSQVSLMALHQSLGRFLTYWLVRKQGFQSCHRHLCHGG